MDKELAKKTFLDTYQKTFGNISQSCKACDISRQTYYNWIEQDKEFAEALKSVEPQEIFLDFAENKLVQKINDGDTAALLFALKTKGKKRGYVERQEIQHEGTLLTLVEGSPNAANEPIKD